MKSENMINANDFYNVMCAMVPLYFAMLMAYVAMKWLNLFTKEQSSGIQKFVALFAIPMLAFKVMSQNNPYQMNKKFILGDTISKIVILASISLWAAFLKRGTMDWVITLFSLGTLPNTIIIGVPLLRAMYGDFTQNLMSQVVGLQLIIWFNLLIVIYECRAATLLIKNGLRGSSTGAYMTKVDIESDGLSVKDDDVSNKGNMISIDGQNSCTTPENQENGEIAVTVSPSTSSMPDNALTSPPVKDRDTTVKVPMESKRVGYQKMLHSTFLFRLILSRVLKKLLVNPNIYASVLGLIWSLIEFNWRVSMPKVVTNSIEIISTVAIGMSMFSLGLFMAQQPRIIACGIKRATTGIVIRFIVGPLVVAASSVATGLRGDILRTAIVQAALPQAVISFVYAMEYGLHAEIFSTVVLFSTLLSLPVTLLYFVFLAL